MKHTLFLLALSLYVGQTSITVSGCKKEPLPRTIYGEWRTLSGLPTPTEYRISEGEICQRYDDYPAGTRICQSAQLSASGDTLRVNGATPYVWVLAFKGDNVVNVMQADTAFATWQAVFTLERK